MKAETNNMDPKFITDKDIETIRADAGARGDEIMVATCTDALEGDDRALEICELIIESALDQLD